jgi:uncharacterized protein YndB with AHSA1/START domain
VTREYSNEIELPADRQAVWRALTDAEELSRWLVESATVEPREGGTYHLSFDEVLELRARIEAWEPGRRLRLATELPLPGQGPIIQEYTLEGRGSVTTMRLMFDTSLSMSDAWKRTIGPTGLGAVLEGRVLGVVKDFGLIAQIRSLTMLSSL